jgi:hypothetical protein
VFRVVADEHKASPFYAQKYHDGGELDEFSAHLGICPDANFELIACGMFSLNGGLDCLGNGGINALATQPSPVCMHGAQGMGLFG